MDSKRKCEKCGYKDYEERFVFINEGSKNVVYICPQCGDVVGIEIKPTISWCEGIKKIIEDWQEWKDIKNKPDANIFLNFIVDNMADLKNIGGYTRNDIEDILKEKGYDFIIENF